MQAIVTRHPGTYVRLLIILGLMGTAALAAPAPVSASETTALVKDIRSGSSGSSPDGLVDVNGTLFFAANDGTKGNELWKSDGTTAGTVLVKDINPGSSGSNLMDLTDVNGTLFFGANDGTSGLELWKSDGTEAGTVMVKDIRSGANWSVPDFLTNVNGTLFFRASNATNGQELWKSDGTAEGTVLVKDINPGSGDSNIWKPTNVSGTLFFTANNGTNHQELWKSDGTSAGTVMIKDIYPGSESSGTNHPINFNGTLFFDADDGTNGKELWKSDGTSAGTVLFKEFISGSGGGSPEFFTKVNNTLFFGAFDDTARYELWKSDGTAGGTVRVKDFGTVSLQAIRNQPVDVNGTLFFPAFEGTGNFDVELWKSDGTAAGTVRVKDIEPGAQGSSLRELTNVNGTLFFNAETGTKGQELWKSDGTAAGTVLVKDIRPGSGSSFPRGLTNASGTLFFRADDGTKGAELWKVAFVERLPVVFVPGVAGSILVDRSANDRKLWLNVVDSANFIDLSLFPSDNPSQGIVAPDVLREVIQIGQHTFGDIYGPFLQKMAASGYHEYDVTDASGRFDPQKRTSAGCDDSQKTEDPKPNLFVFAYDWRHDNASNATLLKDYIQCVREFYLNTELNIVAHSMGSLLARRYILDNPDDHHAARLITVGAPWFGAPKLVYVLESGLFMDELSYVDAVRLVIKEIMGSLPGAHQLISSKAYFDLGGGPTVREFGRDLDGDGNRYEAFLYNEMIEVVDDLYGFEGITPGTTSKNFPSGRPGQLAQ